MAGWTANGRNAMADGIAGVVTHIALFDQSGTELTGGSPAYARKAVTWTAAAAGIRDNNAQLLFDVPAGTVAFVAGYTALTVGTQEFLFPVQGASGSLPQACTFDQATDLFTSYAHGFANGDRVVLQLVSGAALPANFNASTVYFVVSSTANTFQLSATLGGSAILETTSFEALAIKAVVETYAAQGQYSIATGALDLDMNTL